MTAGLRAALLALGLLAFCTAEGNADLFVNFGPAGASAETGFTFVPVVNDQAGTQGPFTVDGVDITLVHAGTEELRALDRGNPGAYNGTLGNLTDSWIGTEDEDDATLTIILEGDDLATGTYDWTSYHLDESNQNSTILIRASVDGGATFDTLAAGFPIWSTNDDGLPATVNDFSFLTTLNITSGQDVHFELTTNDTDEGAFSVINGFSLQQQQQQEQLIPEPGSFAIFSVAGILSIALGYFRTKFRR